MTETLKLAAKAIREVQLASSPDFVVRPATDDDLNYVRKTWLQEHAQQSDWIDHVGGGDVYFREHARARDAAMLRGAVTIACRESVPTGICGFAVTEASLVHFVYVKPRWRRLGVATLLLVPLVAERAEFTHRTRLLSSLPVPVRWTFNPYPFLRS